MSRNKIAMALAIAGMGLGVDAAPIPSRPIRVRRLPGEKKRPVFAPLVLTRCDPSQHNTLRHGQVERIRKRRNKSAGRKPNKPYYRKF